MTRTQWRNIGALVLTLVGSLQMVGYALESRALRGIGAASVVAPLPKVFSDVDGLEPFASTFMLRYEHLNGTQDSLLITPDAYGQLAGPYNRRNAYGAALSYAPRLPTPLWTAVYCYGLAPTSALRSELGLRHDDRNFSLTIRTLTAGRHDTWTYAPDCQR